MRTVGLLISVVLALTAPGVGRQDTPPLSLERRIFMAFDGHDFRRALELIEQYLEDVPNSSTMLYNAACAHCRLGDHDEAATYLFRAMQAGFRDFEHMRRDPDLAALRDHPTYVRILEAADRASSDRAAGALEQWRASYGTESYRYEQDEERRLAFASALDAVSHNEMRSMLERQADHLVRTLFDAPPSYFVLIAVPTPSDADELLGDRGIGGLYDHGKRRLITRDIGGSLRHEFFHALHYGHMHRLRQPHPIWIQEGMASLYEDYVLDDDGSIEFLPNERHNVVKNRARFSRLTRWRDLFGMSGEEFMRRPRTYYPQVRSIFEFVADQGKLPAWYRTYVASFREDRTGARALELTFGMPVDEIEEAWQKWLEARPPLDMRVDRGDASIGVEASTDLGENDGVRVQRIIPRSGAALAGIRSGDVIVSVDGRATRSFNELISAVAARAVGDRVTIRLRRGDRYLSVPVTLRPHRGG